MTAFLKAWYLAQEHNWSWCSTLQATWPEMIRQLCHPCEYYWWTGRRIYETGVGLGLLTGFSRRGGYKENDNQANSYHWQHLHNERAIWPLCQHSSAPSPVWNRMNCRLLHIDWSFCSAAVPAFIRRVLWLVYCTVYVLLCTYGK